ncbi:hypothetical protein ACFL6I_06740 [candidate division KSB1 bacterium]
METIIPTPDSLPLPAPAWLLLFLLIFTFILHVLFMNCLFGGTLVAAFSHFKGKRDPNHEQLAKKIYSFMPPVIAFTVNLGVAPLLFVQVLYGHLIYSSSILMAFAWFAVIPLLILGYYGAYLLRFRWEKLTETRTLITWLVAAIFAVIGFIYVNNLSLMLRPETWADHYFQNPATGKLNWSDSQVYPRYLHFLLGAVAVSGLWIMIIGARRKSGDASWSQWTIAYGSKIFFYATAINIAAGLWLLLILPKRVMMIFMGENMMATALFGVAFLLTIAVLFIIRKAGRIEDGRKLTYVGASHVLLILVFMAIMRELLRQAYLEPYFRLDQLPSEPQWTVFFIFVILLIIGLAVLGWMVTVVWKDKESPA